MKKGDTIKGYRIVSDPTTSGGGRCVWAFAVKGNGKFFVKQFLDPKWPTASSMGSAASKEARRKECLGFEERHKKVNAQMNPTGARDGNLVTAIDFFREDTTYYKVTEQVTALSMASLGGLTLRQTAVVLRTLCQSLRRLHRAGIVHGDLKPENVLLQRSATGDLYLAKLIDFDDSYLDGDPPQPDQVVGDQRFGAPEWLSYVKQDGDITAGELTIAADIFTLALVFHVYLVGDMPGYDQSRFGAPAEAVRAGESLRFDERLEPQMLDLMRDMTQLRRQLRPPIESVLNILSDEKVVRGVVEPPVKPEPPRRPPTARTESRVRINFGPSSTPDGHSPTAGEGRLRTNFDT